MDNIHSDDDDIGSDIDGNQYKDSNNNSTRKRSSKGCITCKIRKKRCDEVKPICGDCRRLNRKCAYITDEMSNEEVKALKEEMKLIEKDSKARKRKRKVLDEEANNSSDQNTPSGGHNGHEYSTHHSKKKHKHNSKIVFNPLAMTMASMTNSANTAVLQTLSGTTPINANINTSINISQTETPVSDNTFASSAAAKPKSKKKKIPGKIINITTTSNIPTPNSIINSIPTPNTYLMQQFNNITANDLNRADTPQSFVNQTFNNNSTNENVPTVDTRSNTNQIPYFPAMSPTFDLNALVSPFPQDASNPNNNGYNIQAASPVPPLSLNGEENQTSFIDLFSTGFSKLLQDHFKTENTFLPNNGNINLNHNHLTPADQFSQIQDTFKFSPRFQPNTLNDQQAPTTLNNNGTLMNMNNDYSLLMFNNDNNNHNVKDENNHPPTEKITALIKSNQPPQIYMNPSIVLNSTLANLTPMGQKMYEYYRDKLSYVVCSAPKTENMYLKTFLPMAHVDKSVLYGIMAWSAFHLGMEKQGNYYIKLALQGFFKRPILNEEVKGNIQLICDEVDDNDDEIVKEPEENDDVELYQDLELSRLNRDNMINMRLAAFLILCGVEICKGDVSKWSKYLTYGAKLIKLKGGLERFNESKDEHFLVTNYAYHDITAIQVINERTIHFDLSEYEKMWRKSNELGFSDPLHGISSPVFKILAEINKLVIIVQKLIKRTMKDENEQTKNEQSKSEEFKNPNDYPSQTNGNDHSHHSSNVADSPEERFHGLEEEDYWINGDMDRSSIASSIDEVFMNGIPSTVSDEWIDSDFDKEVVLEDFDQVMLECQNIEQRVVAVKPKIAPGVSNKDLELQLTIFECFQVTAKIHLRQSVLRMNSASIEIQYLTTQLIKLLDVLLGSDVEACLCLPMFIAGMNSVRKKDRLDMMTRFDSFINRYKWKNVSRCQIVIRYIWKLNCKGEKFVDWYAVVKTLGWDLSFA